MRLLWRTAGSVVDWQLLVDWQLQLLGSEIHLYFQVQAEALPPKGCSQPMMCGRHTKTGFFLEGRGIPLNANSGLRTPWWPCQTFLRWCGRTLLPSLLSSFTLGQTASWSDDPLVFLAHSPFSFMGISLSKILACLISSWHMLLWELGLAHSFEEANIFSILASDLFYGPNLCKERWFLDKNKSWNVSLSLLLSSSVFKMKKTWGKRNNHL